MSYDVGRYDRTVYDECSYSDGSDTGAELIGITTEDFRNGPLNDLGITISWEEVTKTTNNISGDETLTYSSAENKTVYFTKRMIRYEQGPIGLIDLGDATILSPTDYGFKKDDKITVRGETYIITEVLRGRADSEHLFDTCKLIKLE